MGRKLLKTVQIITTFRNPLVDPMGTRRGPPLVRGPQFENRWSYRRYRRLKHNNSFTSLKSDVIYSMFISGRERRIVCAKTC